MKHTDAEKKQQQIVRNLRFLARTLDTIYVIPGTKIRVGFDALLGLIPVGGDIVSLLLSLFIVSEGRRLGASRATQAKMIRNLLVDTVIGAIPILGDLFDLGYKANIRNLKLLGIQPDD